MFLISKSEKKQANEDLGRGVGEAETERHRDRERLETQKKQWACIQKDTGLKKSYILPIRT